MIAAAVATVTAAAAVATVTAAAAAVTLTARTAVPVTATATAAIVTAAASVQNSTGKQEEKLVRKLFNERHHQHQQHESVGRVCRQRASICH